MIQDFVNRFMEAKPNIRAKFAVSRPDDYVDIVRAVITAINPDDEYGLPDPNRVHTIDDGEYQGTLLFVIPEVGYQPDNYWAVKVSYGSCSACDTLQSIKGYSDDPITDKELDQYLTLALHIIQGLKLIGGNE